MKSTPRTVLVSACFLGLACDYRCRRKETPALVQALLQRPDIQLIPVCPEQSGGLPTPRPPSEIQGGMTGKDVLAGLGRVVNNQGRDVTEQFRRGSGDALLLAELTGASAAVLQDRSPSCGVYQIYNGCFASTLIPGQGVTAAALSAAGIRLFSGDDEYLEEDW